MRKRAFKVRWWRRRLTPQDEIDVVVLRKAGHTLQEIADYKMVHKDTIEDCLKRLTVKYHLVVLSIVAMNRSLMNP
jgi:hypothetical protein